MGILQRYVLKELAAPTVVSLAFFTVLLLLRHFFTLAEFLLNASVGFGLLVELSAIIVVTLFSLTIPMAALLGVLIGIGRMTAENEVLAIRVAGISLGPIFLPVFILAALTSVLLAWGNRELFPRLANRIESQQRQIQFELLTNLKPGTWYSNLSPKGSNLTIYFDEAAPREPADGPYVLRMKHIAIQAEGDLASPGSGNPKEAKDAKGSEREAFIFAESGKLTGDLATGALTVELQNGTLIPIKGKDVLKSRKGKAAKAVPPTNGEDDSLVISFTRMSKVVQPQVEEEEDQVDPRRMTYGQLREVVDREPTVPKKKKATDKKFAEEWQAYYAARTEIQTRNSFPFSVLAFVLLGVPLAIEIRPRAKSVAFLIAIALIMAYYGMSVWARAVGTSGSDLAWAASLLPNVGIGGIGLFMFWRTQRIV